MTAVKKEWKSMWRGIIGLELKAHQAWYERGRTGEGRMVLVDENLQGANVAGLRGVSFTRCDLSGAELGRRLLDDSEFVECTFLDASLNYSSWERVTLTGCIFIDSYLCLADFSDANIDKSNWTKAHLERTIWRRAHVASSLFVGAYLNGAICIQTRFEGCNFNGADLSIAANDVGGNVASCEDAHFIDCDFRGSNLSGLRLNNTRFERCKFHGIVGVPVFEGPVTFIDADFSQGGDGSDLRSQDAVLTVWRSASS